MTKASRLGRLVTLKNEELPVIKSPMITLSSPDIAMSCHKLNIKYAQNICTNYICTTTRLTSSKGLAGL